jgi:hypothetical protein
VSSSGMSRVIDFYVMRDNKPWCISGMVGELCDLRRHKRYEGLTVSGCGMDMIFAVVYDLGATLYPHGFQPKGRATHESDGGYAFKSASL